MKPADAKRFWSHVMKADGCWEWTGYLSKQGYSRFSVGGITISAQRASWLLHNGEVPIYHSVVRDCGSSLCVNPDHLFVKAGNRPKPKPVKPGPGRFTDLSQHEHLAQQEVGTRIKAGKIRGRHAS